MSAGDTLPDLLRVGLDVVFVGINPSVYSVQKGHYFARPGNRFWPCFSLSSLSKAARRALGVERLEPRHDQGLLAHGFGFTDVAKRATVGVADLRPGELAAGVADLTAKLRNCRPRFACFHGVTGYRHVVRALGHPDAPALQLGQQTLCIGPVCCYVVPNPSGANAHFTRAEQTDWYNRLAQLLQQRTQR